MTVSTPRALAEAWLDAFNRADLEQLLSLYAEDCVHSSPKLRAKEPTGQIRGKAALRTWWADAFARIKGLRYEKVSLTADDERAVLEYLRHAPGEAALPVLELYEVRDGKIVASRVFHG